MTGARTRLGSDVVVAVRHHRALVAVVIAGYLAVYLLAIQNLVVSPGGRPYLDTPSVQVAADWPAKILKQIAPFYYEPVLAIYPVPHVGLLVSPVNVAMGLVLGALVAANLALAVEVYRRARRCRVRAFGGVLGALPGFLTGFVCCVPAITFVVGAQFAVALIALRSYFFPFALVALLASTAWNARRLGRLDREDVAVVARSVAPRAEAPQPDTTPR